MKTPCTSRAVILSLAIAGLFAPAPARAAMFYQDPAPPTTNAAAATTAPATAPAAPAPAAPDGVAVLKVTIVDVTGNVQVRADDAQPWQTAKVGMVVDQGAEFRTGPRSSVRCTIPPDQSFTLDRLGTMKVLQALRDGNKLHTDMVMKYGRTKYSVEAAGLEHEGTIASPSGTLAVRGTVVSLYDQPPFVPQATSYTGLGRFRDAHRQVSVGTKGGGKETLGANQDSPAETARDKGVIDPKFGTSARTASEQEFIASEVLRGGVVSFDSVANIKVVTGGTPIGDDAILARSLPGKLNFVARWFGPADVNLTVLAQFTDPTNIVLGGAKFTPTETLYPGYGLNHSRSGGEIAYDHRGGPNGGTEIAFWKHPAKEAVYGVSATHISGQPVELKLNAFLNGEKQSLFYIDESGSFVRTKTIDVTLTANNFQSGLVFIPAVDVLEQIPITGDDGSSGTVNSPGHTKGGKKGTKGTGAPAPTGTTGGAGTTGSGTTGSATGAPGSSGNNTYTGAPPAGTLPAPPAGSTPRRRN